MDVDSDGSDWDTESIQQETTKKSKQKKVAEDTRSIASKKSTMSKTKNQRGDSMISDTQSITSKKGKKKKTKKKTKGSDDEGRYFLLFFLTEKRPRDIV